MNCLDCDNERTVGVCAHCGAAVCRDHAVVSAVSLTRTVPINRQVAVRPVARRLRCITCHPAHLAATS